MLIFPLVMNQLPEIVICCGRQGGVEERFEVAGSAKDGQSPQPVGLQQPEQAFLKGSLKSLGPLFGPSFHGIFSLKRSLKDAK